MYVCARMYPSTVAPWGEGTEFVGREENLWHLLCGTSNDQVRIRTYVQMYVLNVCCIICNECMYYCTKMYVCMCYVIPYLLPQTLVLLSLCVLPSALGLGAVRHH